MNKKTENKIIWGSFFVLFPVYLYFKLNDDFDKYGEYVDAASIAVLWISNIINQLYKK